MKIAILFTGNIRQFEYIKEIKLNYKYIIDKYNCDVFIYTDNNDFFYNDVQYFSDKNINKLVTNSDENRYYKNTKFINYEDSIKIINNIFNQYFGNNLKKYVIDEYDDNLYKYIDNNNIYHKEYYKYKTKRNEHFKLGLLASFYKVYNCFKLLESYELDNNFKYDIIIKTRFDGVFINLDNINLLNLNYDKLICEYSLYYIYDWWAIGNRFIMEKYCNYYNVFSLNIVENSKLYLHISNGNIINASNNEENSNDYTIEDISDSIEYGLTYLLKKNNIEYTNFNISYQLYKYY